MRERAFGWDFEARRASIRRAWHVGGARFPCPGNGRAGGAHHSVVGGLRKVPTDRGSRLRPTRSVRNPARSICPWKNSSASCPRNRSVDRKILRRNPSTSPDRLTFDAQTHRETSLERNEYTAKPTMPTLEPSNREKNWNGEERGASSSHRSARALRASSRHARHSGRASAYARGARELRVVACRAGADRRESRGRAAPTR